MSPANAAVHTTVATVVEHDGKVLMVEERATEPDASTTVWNQPAGHWESGESLIAAAQRETLEETGWQVEITYLLGIYTFVAPNGDSYCRVCFAAKPIQQLSSRLDPDILRADWLDPRSVLQQPDCWRSHLVGRAIKDYLDGKRYPLEIVQEDPTLSPFNYSV